MAKTRTVNAHKTPPYYPASSQQLFLRSLSEEGADGQSGKTCDAGTIQNKMPGRGRRQRTFLVQEDIGKSQKQRQSRNDQVWDVSLQDKSPERQEKEHEHRDPGANFPGLSYAEHIHRKELGQEHEDSDHQKMGDNDIPDGKWLMSSSAAYKMHDQDHEAYQQQCKDKHCRI